MGDDVDAPHASAWEFPAEATIRDVLTRITQDRYLPTISGCCATWVVWASGRTSLAVIAQQWEEARLLAAGHTDLATLAVADRAVGLHFDYLGQTDPEATYNQMMQSEGPAGA
jgi:hypothetical protein